VERTDEAYVMNFFKYTVIAIKMSEIDWPREKK
jgi:hypothetical protein